ncbi:hypothetical protein BKA63DRAFT_285435 [Paraphoma chrysanthemicola]|nr:hypothetical protein BKA63DRAFT_285435 [Paraphoma chrysanthemicola]
MFVLSFAPASDSPPQQSDLESITPKTSGTCVEHMESSDAWTPSQLAKVVANIITERNSRGSPLLRLPGEIRNIIYGYILGGKTFMAAQNKTAPNHSCWVYTARSHYNDVIS